MVRLFIWSLNFQQNAALALDQSILDVDQVENLIKFCPTKEEMELLKVYINEILLCLVCDVILTRPHLPFSCQNYSGDKELLGKCELVLTIYDLWCFYFVRYLILASESLLILRLLNLDVPDFLKNESTTPHTIWFVLIGSCELAII
jgi:hypothetical protein